MQTHAQRSQLAAHFQSQQKREVDFFPVTVVCTARENLVDVFIWIHG